MAPAPLPLERAPRPLLATKGAGPASVMERLHAELARVKALQQRTAQELDTIQARAMAQDKLVLMGQHAACIAHEIKQPLFFLKIYCESLLKGIGGDTEVPAGLLDEAREACRQVERINCLTSQMLRFSRTESGAPAPQEVPAALERALRLMSPRLRQAKVVLTETRDPGPAAILGSAGMLEQLFVNLLQNAIDALEGQACKKIHIRFSRRPGQVRVSFRDNGPGVPRAIRERIFEPFFTTKESGQGTGLGLAICADIVRVHQGGILLNTKRKIGTEFILKFPAPLLQAERPELAERLVRQTV